MPFGPNCEYENMQQCIEANSDKDDPGGWCAEVMRNTEDHCKLRAILGKQCACCERLSEALKDD